MLSSSRTCITVACILLLNSMVEAQQNPPQTGGAHSILQRIGTTNESFNSHEATIHVAALPQDTQSTTTVIPRPSQNAQLELRGADLAYRGQLKKFKLSFTPNWTQKPQALELQLGIPPGFEFVDSNVRAQYDDRQQLAQWQLSQFNHNQPIEIYFRAKATGKGPQLFQANVVQNQRVQKQNQWEVFVVNKQSDAAGAPTRTKFQSNAPIVVSEPINSSSFSR